MSSTFASTFLIVTLVCSHKLLHFVSLVAGTTGLEPATSAVTVSLKPVTYRNAGQWVAPIGPKRYTEEPLLCPCCALKFSLKRS